MPSDVKQWKRIELPAELHRTLEQAAAVAHLSTQAYAAYLISRGLQQDAALAELGPRDRDRFTSTLAARIVAEGSPSPTLAALQQKLGQE